MGLVLRHKNDFANTVDPVEVAHYKPSHCKPPRLDLRCLLIVL